MIRTDPTRMSEAAKSVARLATRFLKAAFDIAKAVLGGHGLSARPPPVNSRLPVPRSRIAPRTSCAEINAPTAPILYASRTSPADISSGRPDGLLDALNSSTSGSPSCVLIAAKASLSDCSSAMSAAKPTPVIPCVLNSLTCVANACGLRAISATVKPSDPNRWARANPIPGPAPTTTAIMIYTVGDR